MISERAKTEDNEEREEMLKKAKRDYENALNRFNATDNEHLCDLAIFDMNTAMKRVSVILKSDKTDIL